MGFQTRTILRYPKPLFSVMGYPEVNLLLLLLCGDVEVNPGPPKRGPPGGRPKEPTKEEQMKALQDKVDMSFEYLVIKQFLLR